MESWEKYKTKFQKTSPKYHPERFVYKEVRRIISTRYFSKIFLIDHRLIWHLPDSISQFLCMHFLPFAHIFSGRENIGSWYIRNCRDSL